ncbi:hypothetical protein GWK08_05865 [Leptobacterium flavescens]|uniref:Uncharacterized protein n=1 Tax=Leptobacterium flavescens TaxID=472055 RepID=A0A6P0URG1_9FLAO|nr:hypothetical protein [Leptobacterium flavescens]NER12956.1 hypothetical protein [Leptobacterium flavescens]
MKRTIFILTICLTLFTNTYASNSSVEKAKDQISSLDIKTTDVELLNTDEFDCTLSAEFSYNGVAIKLSITEDDCEKAGAGIAQAVKGFWAEVSGEN